MSLIDQKTENYNKLFNELKNQNVILFWKIMEKGHYLKYGSFSNFSHHSFEEDGIIYRTSEHYYQANKTQYKSKFYMAIVDSLTPHDAAKLGRASFLPLRLDWEDVKVSVMYHALYLKFTQNPELKEVLLSTGKKYIVEDSPTDYQWGCGADRTGNNCLGKCLMDLRSFFRNEKIDIDEYIPGGTFNV